MARDKRDVMLRAHRSWARICDLEDCFGQATLELLLRAQRGGGFQSAAHIANALEQKLRSRIRDRRRALAGRSAIEAALEGAATLGEPCCGGIEVPDPCAPVHERVVARLELRNLLACFEHLTPDQRLALCCQVGLDMGADEFCRRFGWSIEKYRKVLQRGRARLRRLAVDDIEAKPACSARAGSRGSSPRGLLGSAASSGRERGSRPGAERSA